MGEWGDLKSQYGSGVKDPRYKPFAQETEARGEWDEMKRRALLEKQKADEQGVDLDTGGDWIDRIAAGIKITPQGRQGYLESKFGSDNVRSTSGGELEFRRGEEDKWTRFDEQGASWRDIADFSGDAIEAVPAAIAGTLTLNPLGAAAGASAGNIARQGASALIPGDEGLGVTDRAAMAGTSALLGAGSQLGANKLINMIDKARPHNLMVPLLVNDGNDRIARVGTRLMQQTGVPLRKDQITGHPTAQMIVGLMRRHPVTAKMVKDQDIEQVTKLRGFIDGVMDGVSTGKIGKERAAGNLTSAYEKYVERLGDTLSQVGGKMFDDVWELSKTLPDQRIMKIDKTIAEWKKIIDDFNTPLGSDTTSKIIDHARTQIAALEKGDGLLNPKQFQRSMSIFSKASAGTGDIIRDVKDRSVQRSIASRVSKALNADLDQTVKDGGLSGEVAEKLSAARDYYRTAATEIESVSNSILSSTTGEPGEAVVKKFLGGWAPSEVRSAMEMAYKVSPESASGMKRAALQEILDRSKPSGSGSVVGGTDLSVSKLITNAGKSDKQLRAMFAATDDMSSYASWKKGIQVARRIADHAGTDGSPTAPLQWTMSLVKSFAGHVWPFDPRAMAVDVASVLAPRTLQRAMLTNDGRQALFEVTKTGNSVRTVATAIAYLKSLDASGGHGTNKTNNAPNGSADEDLSP